MESNQSAKRRRSKRDDTDASFEEIEMQNSVQLEPLGVHDVAELLHPQFAIITGGKSKDGCPLITFPDQNNFHLLSDIEYQRLMLYLTSVPSLQEADLGFHLIIDRRRDRWNSVKTVLLKISVYFPGLIHVVYVIRPASFLQKALSEVSNKLFKEEFKFRMIVLSNEEELLEYIDANQLTIDLGGTLSYSHLEWIQQRVALEKFSARTHEVSNALHEFTKRISETEFPNNVDSTQQLLDHQSLEYSQLKEEILNAAKHGEGLLGSIREKSSANMDSKFNHTPDIIGNVFAVERLLVQLEETERTFDEFWSSHSLKLRNCLELRRFEQDFRELQVNFDSHLKTISEMTEVGETVARVDTLIRETVTFQKLCMVDIERGEEVIASGHQLLNIKNSCPLDCVDPKCNELMRVREILTTRLNKRMGSLVKCRDLMEQIEKANQWCARGVELLASQGIEKCSTNVELAEKSLTEVQKFLSSADEFNISSAKDFKQVFQESITPETKALVTQVLQRIDDVSLMCEKRISSLNKVITRPPRPVQTVNPEPAVPRQPSVGAPMPHRAQPRKTNIATKMEVVGSTNSSRSTLSEFRESKSLEIEPSHDDVLKVKQGHVLSELLETEKAYVKELATIIRGYKLEAYSKDKIHTLPVGLLDKMDVLFGNIDEIYEFHANTFLKDLENCISSMDLVALCFVQKREILYQLYSYYCQNIPRSEQLRESLVDNNNFFQSCQKRLGHKLPLAAYLLKPVQRITKYQLLLRDLLKYCEDTNNSRELQSAVECMEVVLRNVNDSMLQICITGFPVDLSQQGEMLLQGSFTVSSDCKRDLRLRIKPMQRHIFLYQKAMLFCKVAQKSNHKNNYQFKNYLKMSQIGLTESVKGDPKKFEVWLQGRQEVYTIQATTAEQKQTWVNEIKRVLLNQLEELKGEKTKQYTTTHKHLRQTSSWDNPETISNQNDSTIRAMSCDVDTRNPAMEEEGSECIEASWSSDCSNSDEDETQQAVPSGRYIALADYCAVGKSEVNMRDGDIVELLKIGCAGWWFVKIMGTTIEGWAPAAYLESLHRRSSRSSSRSQDKLNDY